VNQRLALLRSVTIVSISTYVEYALGLLVSIWIARALGPDDFGRYAFVVWLCGWLIVCSNHALTTSSTKFVAEAEGAGDPALASHIAYRLDRIQHASSFFVIVLFVAIAVTVQPDEWHGIVPQTIACIVIAVVAKANYAMLVAIAKGWHRFEPEAMATVLSGLLGVCLIALASFAKAGLPTFIAIFAISCLSLNLLTRIACRHYGLAFVPGPVPDGVRTRLNRHLRLTAVFVLLNLFKTRTIEIFLLNLFANAAAVGYFAIAGTLTNGAVQLFSVGLTTTLLPYMAKSFGREGEVSATRVLVEVTRFYWALGAAIAGIGLVATPGLVELMYGNRYVEAIPAIQTTIVFAGLLLLGAGMGAFQTVSDRQDDRIRVAVATLCVNVALGVTLVPTFALAGAVLTYALTRVAELALAIYLVRRATTVSLPLAAMSRLFIVACVATALSWLATLIWPSRYGFILAAIVFCAVYAPLSVLANYWTAEDLRLFDALAGRLGPVGTIGMRIVRHLQKFAIRGAG
jgi:O-antigen/teichoic acid export membrane protein